SGTGGAPSMSFGGASAEQAPVGNEIGGQVVVRGSGGGASPGGAGGTAGTTVFLGPTGGTAGTAAMPGPTGGTGGAAGAAGAGRGRIGPPLSSGPDSPLGRGFVQTPAGTLHRPSIINEACVNHVRDLGPLSEELGSDGGVLACDEKPYGWVSKSFG